jgi:hypothetical protein
MTLKTLALCMAAACLAAQSAPPAAGPEQKAEEARVLERAQRFYELLVAGKARASEEFVCAAGKDDYYAAPKTKPLGAEVGQVQIQPDGKTALVLTMVEDEHILPMGGQKRIMKMSTPTTWKLESGQWCYYLEPAPQKTSAEAAKTPEAGTRDLSKLGQAPAGVKIADIPRLAHAVTASKLQFRIPDDADGKDEIVVTNGLNGPVKLVYGCRKIPGLECKSDKESIGHGGQARLTVEFKFSGTKLPHGVKAALWVEPFHNLMLFPIVVH